MLFLKYWLPLLLMMSLNSCSESQEVIFVIPDRFRGTISLVENHLSGSELIVDKGRIHLYIPPSGTYQMKDLKFMQRWHKTTAIRESGQIIPVAPIPEDDGETVALRYVYSTSTKVVLVLGTKEDAVREKSF